MDQALLLLSLHNLVKVGAAILVLILLSQAARKHFAWTKKCAEASKALPYPKAQYLRILGAGAFLLVIINANVWLPRTEVKSEPVNTTIERQIYDTSREAPPVIPAESDAERRAAEDAARRAKIEAAKDDFQNLPDALE